MSTATVPSPVHYSQIGDGPILTTEGRALIVGSSTHTLVASMMQRAESHATATGSLGFTWKESVHGVAIHADWRREVEDTIGDTTFSMDAVVDALQKGGIPAYVEQTGGGCATIYAGGQHVHEERYPNGDVDRWNRWNVAAGPGWFEGPDWTQGTAALGEFSVSPNDEGESDCVSLPDSVTTHDEAVAWAVAAIAEQVALTSHRTHADWNPARD